MSVEYRMLGPLEVIVDGRAGAARAAAAASDARPSRSVTRTRSSRHRTSSTGCGGTTHRARPANLVQGYVSGLRKALGKEAIETRGAGYVLRVEAGALDLQRFERLAHDGSGALERGRLR